MDIAVTFTAGPDGLQRADWAVQNGDLALDLGLRSRAAVSLFSDARAAADDALPDGSNDRRGWWGDLPLPGEDADPIGSRLWLLARATATEANRLRAEAYARDSFAWAVRSGVAAAVEASAVFAGARADQARLTVTLRRAAGATAGDPRFEFLWSNS